MMEERGITKEELELLERFRSLNDTGKETVLNAIRGWMELPFLTNEKAEIIPFREPDTKSERLLKKTGMRNA